MMHRGPKYKPGDHWYAGSKCNGYEKGVELEIRLVIGNGKHKKLEVEDIEGKVSRVSYKTLWKKLKPKGAKS